MGSKWEISPAKRCTFSKFHITRRNMTSFQVSNILFTDGRFLSCHTSRDLKSQAEIWQDFLVNLRYRTSQEEIWHFRFLYILFTNGLIFYALLLREDISGNGRLPYRCKGIHCKSINIIHINFKFGIITMSTRSYISKQKFINFIIWNRSTLNKKYTSNSL